MAGTIRKSHGKKGGGKEKPTPLAIRDTLVTYNNYHQRLQNTAYDIK